ncbi:ArsR/SmtB family transcription factor [Streptomyces sp. NPDC049040]|uniref:ArsR/SmtB family transcription factor n=1 Tax=Streptomyces sp. NPDC049040 TaxID=3365593 RepID=UPI0037173C54
MPNLSQGEADFHRPAALIGDSTRAGILLALLDGRMLPMSMLAAETGVSASTVSGHLAKLVDGGMLRVSSQGRHRYYGLAAPEVAYALEALARLAPTAPIRSLRAGTRQRALRVARTCYDHLAGRLGVEIMAALLERGAVTGGDGLFHPETAREDCLSHTGQDLDYEVTDDGWTLLARIGVGRPRTRRKLVRYCVDWTEQRHHLSGAVGASLFQAMVDARWVERAPGSRAVKLLEPAADGISAWLGTDLTTRLEPPQAA